jgi:hypothetical protein
MELFGDNTLRVVVMTNHLLVEFAGAVLVLAPISATMKTLAFHIWTPWEGVFVLTTKMAFVQRGQVRYIHLK